MEEKDRGTLEKLSASGREIEELSGIAPAVTEASRSMPPEESSSEEGAFEEVDSAAEDWRGSRAPTSPTPTDENVDAVPPISDCEAGAWTTSFVVVPSRPSPILSSFSTTSPGNPPAVFRTLGTLGLTNGLPS